MNIGEEICGEWLRHVKGCEFVQYNVRTPDVQGEIDVIGMRTRRSPVIVAVAVVLALAEVPERQATAAVSQPPRLSLDAHIEQVIGRGAVNCGTFSERASGPAAEALHASLQCGREAMKQHSAFRIVQYVQGVDSSFAFGVIAERSGSTQWFEYASAPCGGPGCAESFLTTRCTLDEVIVAHEANGFYRFRRMR
jgi:hypothetical protein